MTVHPARYLSCFGTKRGPAALQEDNNHDASRIGIGIGSKPPEAGASARTGSRFPENLCFVEIGPQPARGAVGYGSCHPVGNLANKRGDIELPLNDWLEIGGLFRAGRML